LSAEETRFGAGIAIVGRMMLPELWNPQRGIVGTRKDASSTNVLKNDQQVGAEAEKTGGHMEPGD